MNSHHANSYIRLYQLSDGWETLSSEELAIHSPSTGFPLKQGISSQQPHDWLNSPWQETHKKPSIARNPGRNISQTILVNWASRVLLACQSSGWILSSWCWNILNPPFLPDHYWNLCLKLPPVVVCDANTEEGWSSYATTFPQGIYRFPSVIVSKSGIQWRQTCKYFDAQNG